MNTNHDQITGEELGRALHGQVDGMTEAPLTVGDVQSRARIIRRNRRIAVGAGVAAALAIVVPTAMFAGNGFNRSDELPPATQSVAPSPTSSDTPSPSPTATASATGEPQILMVDGLPEGAPPAIGWFDGALFHTADGSTLPLPEGYGEPVRFDDGWLVTRWADPEWLGQLLAADGTLIGKPFVTITGAVAGRDGLETMYVRDGVLLVHDNATGAEQTVRTGVGDEVRPVGFADGAAYYSIQQTAQVAGHWFRDGTDHVLHLGYYSVADVTPDGWVSALTEVTDNGSCSVTASAHGDRVGRTCELQFQDFSPTGQLVTAFASYRDGFGDGELAVVPRDFVDGRSTPLLHFLQTGADNPTIMAAVWEDDEHLLVTTFQHNVWQVVRVGLDGSLENAIAPTEVPADEAPAWWVAPH